MRIALVTDTWFPQINGVVTTLSALVEKLRLRGYEVDVIEPSQFFNIPCPTYPEIRLALFCKGKVAKRLASVDAIHISNEGPLGVAARSICHKNDWPYTTAFHTRLSEYANERFKSFPVWLGYKYIKWFHKHSKGVLVPTKEMLNTLQSYGLDNLIHWSRGVDTKVFRPKDVRHDYTKPVMLYVGRVSVEKNLDSFLSLETPGTKIVVGDGPYLNKLKSKYPDTVFVGYKHGEELSDYYALSDVFVFPSKSDTYGLVQLEALSSGLPVAAYPVTGPLDVINDNVGCLSNSLGYAIESALKKDPVECRKYAESKSWDDCVDEFLYNLEPISNL